MKFWKIAPGGNAYFWDECLERRIISINWMNEDDFTKFESKKELTAALKKKKEGGSNAATSIWKFVHEVQPGHVVFANDGRSAVKGVGVVQSGYFPPDSKRNPNRKQDHHKQVRLVDWKIVEDAKVDYYIFNTPTVGLLDEAQCDELHRGGVAQT